MGGSSLFDDSEVSILSFSEKWTEEIAEFGFTMIPNLMLKHFSLLDMSASEFLVFTQIESYRWTSRKDPYPSVETLAERIGIEPRTVTRTITSMHKKKLINRYGRRKTSNAYSVQPLIDKLERLYVTF